MGLPFGLGQQRHWGSMSYNRNLMQSCASYNCVQWFKQEMACRHWWA